MIRFKFAFHQEVKSASISLSNVSNSHCPWCVHLSVLTEELIGDKDLLKEWVIKFNLFI